MQTKDAMIVAISRMLLPTAAVHLLEADGIEFKLAISSVLSTPATVSFYCRKRLNIVFGNCCDVKIRCKMHSGKTDRFLIFWVVFYKRSTTSLVQKMFWNLHILGVV